MTTRYNVHVIGFDQDREDEVLEYLTRSFGFDDRAAVDLLERISEGEHEAVLASGVTNETMTRLRTDLEALDVVLKITETSTEPSHSIFGEIITGSLSLTNATVRLFNVTSEGDHLLGEVAVPPEGSYDIEYILPDSEEEQLVVRVVDEEGVRGKSTPIPTSTVETRENIDVVTEVEPLSGADTDIFQFIALRPPQEETDPTKTPLLVDSEITTEGEIDAPESGEEESQTIYARLLKSKSTEDGSSEFYRIASEFVASDEFVTGFDDIQLDLAALDVSLSSTGPRDDEELATVIHETLGIPVEELLHDDSYLTSHRQVVDSLAALSVLPNKRRTDTLIELRKAVRLFHLIDLTVQEEPVIDSRDAIKDVLSKPLALPGLFPLPTDGSRAIDTPSDEEAEKETKINELATELERLEIAKEELESVWDRDYSPADADQPTKAPGAEEVNVNESGDRSQSSDEVSDDDALPDGDDSDLNDSISDLLTAVERRNALIEALSGVTETNGSTTLGNRIRSSTDFVGDVGLAVEGASLKLSSKGRESLSDETIEIIAALNIDLDRKTVPAVLDQIEMRESELGGEYYSIIGETSKQVISLYNEGWEEVSDVFINIPEPNDLRWRYGDRLWEENLREALGSSASGPGINPLGFGDLRVVRQTPPKYELGEIAHIENVMRSEEKDRDHRRTIITEDVVLTEEETTEEEERDLQSTERFELQKEAESVANEESSLEHGLSVSAKYGPAVEVNTNYKYDTSRSKEASKRSSRIYGKEITDKTAKRIATRTLERRIQTRREEVEELNSHSFKNADGDHTSGIYRWVDKYYWSQVFSYETPRYMYEFIVPEPAVFYLHAFARNPVEGVSMEKPKKPVRFGATPLEERLLPGHLNPSNYQAFISAYSVTDFEAPPPSYAWATEALTSEAPPSEGSEDSASNQIYESTKIDLRDGYQPKTAYVFIDRHFTAESGTGAPLIHVTVFGGEDIVSEVVKPEIQLESVEEYLIRTGRFTEEEIRRLKDGSRTPGDRRWLELYRRLRHEGLSTIDDLSKFVEMPEPTFSQINVEGGSNPLPISVMANNTKGFNAAVTVFGTRNGGAYSEWQIKTYNAIMDGYRQQLSEYERQLEQAAIQAGVQITGNNPLRNREIERTELKRNIVTLLRNETIDYTNLIDELADLGSIPEINLEVFQTTDYSEMVQFLEHAFEWDAMLYSLYPYYWGRRQTWADNLLRSNPDSQFARFLGAGAARVVVPVRPGYERDVMYFIEKKAPYSGEGRPPINSEKHVHIVNEIKELETGAIPTDEAVTESWPVRLPTDLVKLQDSPETLPDLSTE